MKTDKLGWLIPALIVAANAIAILVCWHSLPEMLQAHFDLQGNASGSLPRGTLLLYPAAGAVICGIAYGISRLTSKRLIRKGLVFLASGIALVIFSSTMVSLTKGTMPIFMLAEPVILLAAMAAFVICLIKARKKG